MKTMPLYKCHKTVSALKIAQVKTPHVHPQWRPEGTRELVFEDESYPNVIVGPEFTTRHRPQSGGYYVVYEDGYASYSPCEAFEAGYTLIVPPVEEVAGSGTERYTDGSGSQRYKRSAVDWTQTKGAGMTDDTSAASDGAEYKHGSGNTPSSAITPVTIVELPTQADADAVVSKAEEERKQWRAQ